MTTINDQNMDNQEKIDMKTLGRALKDARLSASLTVEDVAEKLNLAISSVQDIEDNLEKMIEDEKYPLIYLRGYIANFAKLVALQELDQFIEYQQLLAAPKKPSYVRSSRHTPVKRKSGKRLFLFLFLLVVIAIGWFVAKPYFLTNNDQNIPVVEEMQSDADKVSNAVTHSIVVEKKIVDADDSEN